MHGFVKLFYLLTYIQYHGIIIFSSSGKEERLFRDKRSTWAQEKKCLHVRIQEMSGVGQEKAEVQDLRFSLEQRKVKSRVLHRNATCLPSILKEERPLSS